MNANKVFKKMLAFGYFPEKLKGIFNSEDFSNLMIEKGESILKGYNKKDFSNIRYKLTRNNNAPRILSIPHPIAYYKLCKCLKNNWKELEKRLIRSEKISQVHLKENNKNKRLFSINSYDKNFSEKLMVLNKRINVRYIVNADISNFFPSIYTHALSWALVGKKESKNKKESKYNNLWFNQIDLSFRNTQRKETKGVHIGPDTSNIAAELILSEIDYRLLEKGFNFIRYIDDYNCFCKNKVEAEKFIILLSNLLEEYCLELNVRKTKIISLPESINENWIRQLRNLSHLNFNSINQILDYLDQSVELFNKNPDDSPIRWAAQVLACRKYKNYNIFSAIIYYFGNISLLYPYIIDIFDELFEIASKLNKTQTKQDAKNILNIILEEHMLYRRSDVLLWSFYLGIKYNLKLKFKIKKLIETRDCLSILMGYIYCKINNKNINNFLSLFDNIVKEEEEDEWWLYIYELYRIESNHLSNKKFKDKSFYDFLKKNKISFLNNIILDKLKPCLQI